MHLNLLVLRCRDIEATRTFYTQLGLTFTREQHGSDPVHYSTYMPRQLLCPVGDNYLVRLVVV